MAIEFNCPHCQKFLTTSDDKAGRTAQCPGCGQSINVPDSATAAGEADDSPLPPDSAPVEQPSDTRSCPMCGGEVKAAATRCKHCGETLQSTRFEAGETFSRTWQIFNNQMGICIGGVVVAVLVSLAARIPGEAISRLIQNRAIDRDMIPFAMMAMFGFMLLAMAVQVFVTIGENILLLKIARGEHAEIGDIFRGGPWFWRMLGCSIVFGLIAMLGYVLCIVPGILVTLMLWPFGFILIDENPPGLESLSRAKQITEGNWGAVFVLFLIALGVNLLGLLACGVGLIFTAPLTTLSFAVAYDAMTGFRRRPEADDAAPALA